MKLLIFLVLVLNYLLVDAKFVPSKSYIHPRVDCDDDTKATFASVAADGDNVVIAFNRNKCDGTERIFYDLGDGKMNEVFPIPSTNLVVIKDLPLACASITFEIVTSKDGFDEGFTDSYVYEPDANCAPSKSYIHPRVDCDDDTKATIEKVSQQVDDVIITFNKNKCDGTEKIFYDLGDGNRHEVFPIPSTNLVLINDLPLACTSIRFEIVTTKEDGAEEFTDTKDFEPVLPAVTGLSLELTPVDNAKEGKAVEIYVKVSWELQTIAETCELSYLVKYGDDSAQSITCETPEDCQFPISELTMCEESDISVTAVKQGYTADSANYKYTRPIDSIPHFESEREDGKVRTTFQPLSITACGELKYTVIHEDGECFKTMVSVDVVPEEHPEAIASSAIEEFNKGPGRVINVAYKLDGDEVDITWDTPVDGEECSLWYTVKYNDGTDNKLITTHFTSVRVLNQATACKRKPITIGASNGEAGPETTLEVEGALGGVQSMECNYGTDADRKKVTCIWTAPAKTDGCTDLKYQIRYSTGKDEEENDSTQKLLYDFTVDKCENIWIQVIPKIDDREGIPMDTVLEDRVLDCNPPAPMTWWKSFV